MRSAKEHKSQQSRVIQNRNKSSIIQRGRGKDILNGNPLEQILVLKFNFGGSGYLSFPHRQYSKKSAKPLNDIYNLKYRRGEIRTFFFCGPQGLGGIRDSGENSIKKNIKSAKEKFYYEERSFSSSSTITGVYILVKGHSRGGVAASRFANWLKGESDKANSKVIRVELTLLDPVPGPLHFGKDNKITTLATQSTVIYSLTADRDLFHKIGFTPQIIRGADRIILTYEGHDCGTGTRDTMNKKIKYCFNEHIYSLSQLNQLPKGIYYAKKRNDVIVLTRVTEDINSFISQYEMHRDRETSIKEAIINKK